MALNPNTLAGRLAGSGVTPTQPDQIDIDDVAVNPNTAVFTNVAGDTPTAPITVYQRFASSDVITNQVVAETRGLWSNSSSSLSTFYTASTQTSAQKEYYLEVNSTTASCEIIPEFFIAYGNKNGYGAPEGEGQVNDTPTRAIYTQYKQLLLDPSDVYFSFKSGSVYVNSDSIYVINLNSKLIGDKVDPGNFELSLAKLTGDVFAQNTYTASSVIAYDTGSPTSTTITLIDDSLDYFDISPSITTTTRVFNIVSGTIETGKNSSETESYGLFYADYGVMILNANKLNSTLAFNTTTSSNSVGNNNLKLFKSIQGASVPRDPSGQIYPFYARKVDIKTTSYYYVRLRNYQYNYSTNPTYYTGSLATVVYPDFKYNPVSYITSVGLYNTNYELLAVAKLSKPLKKTFFDEYLLTIKLEY